MTDRALPPLSPNAWLRWEVVSRLLPPADPRLTVLELGCGQGGFAARLAQRFSYLGVEPDPQSYALARQRLAATGGTGEVRRGDLSLVGPHETFHLVCAFEVIEHIEHDVDALRDWASRLRPGGTLLLSTPAWQKRFAAADEMAGHFRRYDPPVLEALLRDVGLVDVKVMHFGMPLGYLLEAGRNVVGRRVLAADTGDSKQERTCGSGRLLQPSTPLTARLAEYGTLPFRTVQRAFPRTGPGLVATGRRPAD